MMYFLQMTSWIGTCDSKLNELTKDVYLEAYDGYMFFCKDVTKAVKIIKKFYGDNR